MGTDTAAEPWDAFIAELHELVPGLTDTVGPGTTVGELLGGDRIVKGLVSAALRRLLHSPPEEMLSPDSTLGEVFEWSLVRAEVEQPSTTGAARAMRAGSSRRENAVIPCAATRPLRGRRSRD